MGGGGGGGGGGRYVVLFTTVRSFQISKIVATISYADSFTHFYMPTYVVPV